MGMFASDPEEARFLLLSPSHLTSYRWMLLLLCLGAAGVRVTQLSAALPEGPGQGGMCPSA